VSLIGTRPSSQSPQPLNGRFLEAAPDLNPGAVLLAMHPDEERSRCPFGVTFWNRGSRSGLG
jgi:hypothetical protein